MKILFIGKKQRAINCFERIKKRNRHQIIGVIADDKTFFDWVISDIVYQGHVYNSLELNVNNCICLFKPLVPDLIVVAGFSQILKKSFLDIAKYGAINLHAGKLPEYRDDYSDDELYHEPLKILKR